MGSCSPDPAIISSALLVRPPMPIPMPMFIPIGGMPIPIGIIPIGGAPIPIPIGMPIPGVPPGPIAAIRDGCIPIIGGAPVTPVGNAGTGGNGWQSFATFCHLVLY